MTKRSFVGILAAAVIVMAVGASRFASATITPSGNMNLRLQGHEIIAANEVSMFAIGQEIVDTTGSFSGDLTFTYVDTASTSTGVCGGSITGGAISAQGGSFGTLGSGQFTIAMTFTPQTTVASTACVTTAFTLLCNRTLAHPKLTDDLNAGQYHCVVTDAAGTGISAASLDGHLDLVRGSNAPQS